MLRPTVGVALLTVGTNWPDPLADALDDVGAVVPEALPRDVVPLDGDGDADALASARSLATTAMACALRLAVSGR